MLHYTIFCHQSNLNDSYSFSHCDSCDIDYYNYLISLSTHYGLYLHTIDRSIGSQNKVHPLLYQLALVFTIHPFYLLIAVLSCIFFSFYAAFKVTLSDDYYVLCGYIDPLKIVFANISIFVSNNTREFHIYLCQLKNYRLDQDQGEEVWDISLVSWC
eukprot:287583_1